MSDKRGRWEQKPWNLTSSSVEVALLEQQTAKPRSLPTFPPILLAAYVFSKTNTAAEQEICGLNPATAYVS